MSVPGFPSLRCEFFLSTNENGVVFKHLSAPGFPSATSFKLSQVIARFRGGGVNIYVWLTKLAAAGSLCPTM